MSALLGAALPPDGRHGVRIHTDRSAAQAVGALGADAYTKGSDIFFGAGLYRPETTEGKRLLLHEMAHVVQQRNPGPTASKEALEQEADRVAETAISGRTAQVALAAPAGQAQCQGMSWVTGDVFLTDAVSRADVMQKGGLFSGNDQAHVNVSNQGKLAYDTNYTTPEDPFRWSKLKEIVDTGHLKIQAVAASDKFQVVETPGKPAVDRSITEIGLMVGDISTKGIALRAGVNSPDPVYDLIYYDKAGGIGALTHELFGHAWLALKKAPSAHPPSGSAAEASIGTIRPANAITDPFGNVYSGTVRNYIATYIESLGTNTNVVSSTGQNLSVPKSPTQGISKAQFTQAFQDFYREASGAGFTVTKTATSVDRKYSPKSAQLWRLICNSYDLMPTNAAGIAAGNTDLTFTKEVILYLAYIVFTKLTNDQQSVFRILLSDFANRRSGFSPNELSSKLETLVGPAPSPFSPSSGAGP